MEQLCGLNRRSEVIKDINTQSRLIFLLALASEWTAQAISLLIDFKPEMHWHRKERKIFSKQKIPV